MDYWRVYGVYLLDWLMMVNALHRVLYVRLKRRQIYK
jgi:hypothetical protein